MQGGNAGLNSNEFYLKRLHSLMGVVPLTFFLCEHILTITRAIAGPKSFDAATALLQSLPMLVALELLFIALPLLFHGVYGVYITLESKNNAFSYSYPRNWSFYLQRITAIVTLLFVAWHVWMFRFGGAGIGQVTTYAMVAKIFADPVILALHAIGFVCAVFHLTNGLWTFLITWGVTVGPRAQQVSQYVAWALCAVLNAGGLVALTYFRG